MTGLMRLMLAEREEHLLIACVTRDVMKSACIEMLRH